VSTLATLSIPLVEDSLASILPSSPNQTTLTNASTVNAASTIPNDSSGDSQNTLTADTVTLLNGAQSDTSAANPDLNTQDASTTSTEINQALASLFKNLNVGNETAVNSDITNLNTAPQTQAQSTANSKAASGQDVGLANLFSRINDSLKSGNIQGALQDVAGYLVQNGQVTGSLLNVTA
jgi:hypothetical protein